MGRFYVAAELAPTGTTAVNMQMKALQLPMVTVGQVGFGVDIEIRADEVTPTTSMHRYQDRR
ncbi:hypothetical protein KXD97_19995 [Mycobacterium sp. SMC-8]|uniref:hypothetical protein n=1 Tax=Mycobacterium sp. SMC-8 TaxID=2857060 RepID=UPI0021B3F991|nr:hypothetical protein [Mycobacterium sp. SMC-8]UXA10399.1 hypothetical protein KXD97_19995 [Mycobacterium sp. SMC-8]